MPASAVNLENQSVIRILESALGCFGRRGFDGASMSDIAREAGVSKSLLHYHFDSKDALFLECQLHLLRDLLTQMRGLAAVGNAGIRQFDKALQQTMDFVEENLEHILVVLSFHNASHHSETVITHMERFTQEILSLIEEAIHNVLGPLVDRLVIPPDRLARLLWTLFNGLIVDLAFATNQDARARVRQTFDDVRALFTPVIFGETN